MSDSTTPRPHNPAGQDSFPVVDLRGQGRTGPVLYPEDLVDWPSLGVFRWAMAVSAVLCLASVAAVILANK